MPAQAMKVMLLLLLALLVVSQATTGKCRHNHRALFRLTLCLHKDLLTWGQAFFTCENPKKGAYRLFFCNYSARHCHVSEDQGRVLLLAVLLVQEIHRYLLQWPGEVLHTLVMTIRGPCRVWWLWWGQQQ